MKSELLSREEWRHARDHYAITCMSNLPKGFYWADKMRIPRQQNLSDCGRAVAILGMKMQGIKYPNPKYFRSVVNTGGTGIDMYDLELAMRQLGVDCKSWIEVNAATIISELRKSPDMWVFSHQMLAGTYKQYLQKLSGHYAVAGYTDGESIFTTDSGIQYPRFGRISPHVYDRINFDTKIVDPENVIYGWAMRVGVSKRLINSV